ncbi:hypothetical protein [Microbacterium sp. USHLN186]|uniref:hypothetical protein n=1 Tax=Microbacterium sp. USHLN186 TaxID=3081286 RepID=UPI00301951B3
MISFPDGWASGTWRITGTSLDPGWLPVPAIDSAPAAEAWVHENTELLRHAWAPTWTTESAQAVPEVLRAGLAHRRPDDALAFQLWPAQHPLCVFVHVAMGRGDGVRPGPGDGILFVSEGLGPGVLIPRSARIGDGDVLGYDIVFSFEGDVVVIVSVEPTFADLLGIVSASIHTFTASLQLVAPDGLPRRALQPELMEAQPANSWIDSLTAS